MATSDEQTLEDIWRRAWGYRNPDASSIEVIADFRRYVQEAIGRHMFGEVLHHRSRGTRPPFDDLELDVRHQIIAHRGRPMYVDIMVSGTLFCRRMHLRQPLDQYGEDLRVDSRARRRAGLRVDRMYQDDLDSWAMGRSSSDQIDALGDVYRDMRGRLATATSIPLTALMQAPSKKTVAELAGLLGIGKSTKKIETKKCGDCAGDLPTHHWSPTCTACQGLRTARSLAIDKLLAIIRKVNEAVALGMAAGLSLRGIHFVMTKPSYSTRYESPYVICATHGVSVGQVIRQTPGGPHQVTIGYTCHTCMHRGEALKDASDRVVALMILGARALWESIDDFSKRLLLAKDDASRSLVSAPDEEAAPLLIEMT